VFAVVKMFLVLKFSFSGLHAIYVKGCFGPSVASIMLETVFFLTLKIIIVPSLLAILMKIIPAAM